jgi:hypothetical protein
VTNDRNKMIYILILENPCPFLKFSIIEKMPTIINPKNIYEYMGASYKLKERKQIKTQNLVIRGLIYRIWAIFADHSL